MIITVVDGQGVLRSVSWQAQDAITDRSGSLATAATQVLMTANTSRAGWFFQNLGTNPMRISELGADATLNGAIMVRAGETFPPPGYPIPTGAIEVAGTAGDLFTAREW